MEKTKGPYIVSLADFVKEYPHMVNMSQMRALVRNSKTNGSSKWIRKVGVKIFVDVEQFFEWTKKV